ncbi:hypothetical protein RHECNPAF_345002 [Rhizobium etli CNPAF512]|nr:hypothetical protein RHECNPAF_345002 [Rhizobium etli CNPAF512]
MIENDPQTRVGDFFQYLRIGGEQAVVRDALVIEGRQHHHLGDAERQCVPRQFHGLRNGDDASARQKPVGWNAGLHSRFQNGAPLATGEGIGLTGGAEQGHAMASLGQQSAAMIGEKREIRRVVCCQRRCGRAEDASDPMVAHIPSFGASWLADPCPNRATALDCHASVCDGVLRTFPLQRFCQEDKMT